MECRDDRIPAADVERLTAAIKAFRAKIDQALKPFAKEKGWFAAPYDPTALIECFPHLRLRRGIRLAAYQFQVWGLGEGVVFAVPAKRSLPPPTPSNCKRFWRAGSIRDLPTWADRQIGKYLQGDESPISYFEASLFLREITEVGAVWHGCWWSTHTVLTSDPFRGRRAIGRTTGKAKSGWRWVTAAPEDFRPAVLPCANGRVVEFYSQTGRHRCSIACHLDCYHSGYDGVLTDGTAAVGPEGYFF